MHSHNIFAFALKHISPHELFFCAGKAADVVVHMANTSGKLQGREASKIKGFGTVQKYQYIKGLYVP